MTSSNVYSLMILYYVLNVFYMYMDRDAHKYVCWRARFGGHDDSLIFSRPMPYFGGTTVLLFFFVCLVLYTNRFGLHFI